MLSPFYKQCSWDSKYLRHLTNTQLVIDRVAIQSQTCLMPKTYALPLYHFNRWQKALLSDLLDQDGRDSNLDSSTWYFLCWGSINHGWAWDPAWKYKRELRGRTSFGGLGLLFPESQRETPSAALETLTLAQFKGELCPGANPQNQDCIAKKSSSLEESKPVRGTHEHQNIWLGSSPDLEPIVVATS